MEDVKLIECPRDAWQGLPNIIPTESKIAYLRALLDAGFRHIDAVSFVSPKYVPQMADSECVMESLAQQVAATRAEIIGIVVNEQGFRRALATPGVTTIGYPYSISERFARQNANMSLQETREFVARMAREVGKQKASRRDGGPDLVIYISMAFGNPYGDPWTPDLVAETAKWLHTTGVDAISLADTVGRAEPQQVGDLFRATRQAVPAMEIGLHLHSRPANAAEKVVAAFETGCRRFDSALTGLGGCPFSGDELVGNIPTEIVLTTLAALGVSAGIGPADLEKVLNATQQIRARYAH
ncbi:MAG: hydroxymethylglutaryl-CoA lyase [Acidobacteria bacterium]|nr:hydroxymethylglutaryl-CoA lyase [Acidobacteriota bacterium]